MDNRKFIEDEMKQVGRELAQRSKSPITYLNCLTCRGSGTFQNTECGTCGGTGRPNELDQWYADHQPSEKLEEDGWVFI